MNLLKSLSTVSIWTTSILATVLGTTASATAITLGGSNLDSVVVNRENLFPEGVEYSDRYEQFLLSSLTEGTIYQVSADGTAVPFIEDDRLVSSIGIELDVQQNRLLVANSDPGVGEATSPETQRSLAALGIYDVSTGDSLAYTNLGILRPNAPHFANDVATDDAGNAYVTDSFSPIIYKVDSAGNPSIFLENERFQAPTGAFGLNGIVSHPDGFLIVAQSDEGLLFKVPLDNPEAFSTIEVGQSLTGADGLYLIDENSLVLVSNSLSQVFALTSNNNWQSADIVDSFATGDVFPTTATTREDEIFVLYAQLNKLLDPNNTASVEEFTIQQVGVVTDEDTRSVPEPASNLGLLALGVLGVASIMWKR